MNGQSFAEAGYLRAAVASPSLTVGDPRANTAEIIATMERAARDDVALLVTPELSLTGYTAADLFYQSALRQAALAALEDIAAATARLGMAVVVGLPLEVGGRLYNTAALIAAGAVVGFVPKTFLPTSGEFYEERWFSSGRGITATVCHAGRDVPFGADLLFEVSGVAGAVFGIEICEDLWAPEPPSGQLATGGATIIANPSASDDLVGKAAYRRDLVSQASGRLLAAYLYAAAGPGESSTDVVYGGHSMIAENGSFLGEAPRFRFDTQLVIADLDLERLRAERIHSSSFSAARPHAPFRVVRFELPALDRVQRDLRRPLSPTPFVPPVGPARAAVCEEILSIQATALARRLRATGAQAVTIGVSGGLDSTLALLVAARAFDALSLPRTGIHALSMPGPGTTSRTRNNGEQLATALGVELHVIPIGDAVAQHLRAIGHDGVTPDVTFENAQARERTQILMDLGNEVGGFVIGTGDLSELALGWATYNGDHMSGYGVNAGVPKTLVRDLVTHAAETTSDEALCELLLDICATPISPELLPTDGEHAVQSTESLLGSYRLHDFFLYYAIRYGFSPRRVFFLASLAFQAEFDAQTIARTLRTFYARFFANQFKRSALPDGPKVGTVALSPRGDWRMPSDAAGTVWLAEVDAIIAEIERG